MALEPRFKRDGRKTAKSRNKALVNQLQSTWSGLDIVKVERQGTGNKGGWKVTFHKPPRPGTT